MQSCTLRHGCLLNVSLAKTSKRRGGAFNLLSMVQGIRDPSLYSPLSYQELRPYGVLDSDPVDVGTSFPADSPQLHDSSAFVEANVPE